MYLKARHDGFSARKAVVFLQRKLATPALIG